MYSVSMQILATTFFAFFSNLTCVLTGTPSPTNRPRSPNCPSGENWKYHALSDKCYALMTENDDDDEFGLYTWLECEETCEKSVLTERKRLSSVNANANFSATMVQPYNGDILSFLISEILFPKGIDMTTDLLGRLNKKMDYSFWIGLYKDVLTQEWNWVSHANSGLANSNMNGHSNIKMPPDANPNGKCSLPGAANFCLVTSASSDASSASLFGIGGVARIFGRPSLQKEGANWGLNPSLHAQEPDEGADNLCAKISYVDRDPGDIPRWSDAGCWQPELAESTTPWSGIKEDQLPQAYWDALFYRVEKDGYYGGRLKNKCICQACPNLARSVNSNSGPNDIVMANGNDDAPIVRNVSNNNINDNGDNVFHRPSGCVPHADFHARDKKMLKKVVWGRNMGGFGFFLVMSTGVWFSGFMLLMFMLCAVQTAVLWLKERQKSKLLQVDTEHGPYDHHGTAFRSSEDETEQMEVPILLRSLRVFPLCLTITLLGSASSSSNRSIGKYTTGKINRSDGINGNGEHAGNSGKTTATNSSGSNNIKSSLSKVRNIGGGAPEEEKVQLYVQTRSKKDGGATSIIGSIASRNRKFRLWIDKFLRFVFRSTLSGFFLLISILFLFYNEEISGGVVTFVAGVQNLQQVFTSYYCHVFLNKFFNVDDFRHLQKLVILGVRNDLMNSNTTIAGGASFF